MTSSHVKLLNLFFIGVLFSTERTKAGTLHGNVGGYERKEDDVSRADISCVLIYDKGRISTNQEARVCLPLQTIFNVSCTLLEEPNTVIDRHRRSVAGSLRTEESNQYIDSSCRWENTDGTRPKCTLLFSGLYYSSSGEETISIRVNYKNIVKNLDFQIFDPSIAHPFCNPWTTTILPRTTTEPEATTKVTTRRIAMTTKLKRSDVKIADPQSGDDDKEDTSSSKSQIPWQILLPVAAVVVICLVLVVVFMRRRRTNESPRDEYEAVKIELNENG